MSMLVFHKLLAIFVTVALGWIAGRMRWLGQGSPGSDPARTLSNAAFYIFVPALLFRTTARLDPSTMPWGSVVAFFVPVVAMLLVVYAVQRWRGRAPTAGGDLEAHERAAAAPSARAIAATFGNSLQVGVPLVAGLFGEKGLGIHIALISLHALILLSVLTVLVELDLARARARHEATAGLLRTLRVTVRNTIIHPVVLPVLAGMLWNVTGWPLPGPLDETLALLGTAVPPMCLVLIGLSLAYSGTGGGLRGALVISLLKLIALPALVLAAAYWGFGLTGLPLQVVVLMAALPTGSNALMFAQRYRVQEAEATTTIVVSTLGFVLTAPLWLAVLGAIA
ncbi:AEC family transporter [Aquincola sp. S2]|uniref:AEC family transporter n=1 Tax=Pseudaquabacterium terrae TaxID=2732868 RepID=A0ABX2ECQ3_9BURK|nr:AEC family transporter [Aquabacterium terrae]NRF66207.1 AEC family transporter [Aquabacterium terrae]